MSSSASCMSPFSPVQKSVNIDPFLVLTLSSRLGSITKLSDSMTVFIINMTMTILVVVSMTSLNLYNSKSDKLVMS
jgi:hypothetical protein